MDCKWPLPASSIPSDFAEGFPYNRNSASTLTFESECLFQPCLHFRPLMIEDALVDRISHTPGRGNEVLAERPFFFRADPKNCVA